MTAFYYIKDGVPEGFLNRKRKENSVILCEELANYIYDNCRYSKKIFHRSYRDLLDNMPEDLYGVMTKNGEPLDYMPIQEHLLPGIVAVISQRVVDIFEALNVKKSEYINKRIDLKGCHENYYILFLPSIPINDIIFPESCFRNNLYNEYVVFENYESYHKYLHEGDNLMTLPKIITLPGHFRNNDILDVGYGRTYISKRLLKEFQRQEITGYEVIKPHEDRYVELRFEKEDLIKKGLNWLKIGKS